MRIDYEFYPMATNVLGDGTAAGQLRRGDLLRLHMERDGRNCRLDTFWQMEGNEYPDSDGPTPGSVLDAVNAILR